MVNAMTTKDNTRWPWRKTFVEMHIYHRVLASELVRSFIIMEQRNKWVTCRMDMSPFLRKMSSDILHFIMYYKMRKQIDICFTQTKEQRCPKTTKINNFICKETLKLFRLLLFGGRRETKITTKNIEMKDISGRCPQDNPR